MTTEEQTTETTLDISKEITETALDLAKEMTVPQMVATTCGTVNAIFDGMGRKLEMLVAENVRAREEIDSLAARIRVLDEEISEIELDGDDINDQLDLLKKERGRANAKREHIVARLASTAGQIERIKLDASVTPIIAITTMLGRLASEVRNGATDVRVALDEGLDGIQSRLR